LLRRGVQRILAFGPADSEDCLAIASFARQFDVQPVLALTRPNSAERALHILEMEHALGAELHRLDGGPRALWRLLRSCLTRGDVDGPRRPRVASPSRLAVCGALGYVNAAYELKRQINCRILPVPERIYVPARSGAAAAGVLLGCQLAEIDSTVVIVSPPDGRSPRPDRIARRAFAALARRSRRVGSTPMPRGALEVRTEGTTRAAAAGSATHAPETLLRDLEALDLDVQFAARSMAALIEDRRRGVTRGPVLFWHTRPARRIDPRPAAPPAGIPQEFREFFVAP
jgi:1-aminocyclopropane-1-carboxylate deaminase/D-cysteine desulfhydrase-like pyridoxal-dependent ACC family enzyme